MLARIAGNKVIESVLLTAYENISPYVQRLLRAEPCILERNYQDLCNITEAIKKRQSDNAKVLAERHLREFTAIVSKESDKVPLI